MWIISKALMNSLCSREQAEESSADAFLVGEPSVQWKSTLTPRPSSSRDKTTDNSRRSLFGTMSALLTDDLGEDVLTSFREAFHARTYHARGRERELRSAADTDGEGDDIGRRTPLYGRREWWKSEPGVGRVADGVANRVDRLRCIGNGQVPLCAATAFRILYKRLNENEKL